MQLKILIFSIYTPLEVNSFLLTINNKINTVINIKVDNAFIDGLIPFLAMEYISIERLVTPGPVVKKLITKSSIDMVNAISPALFEEVLFSTLHNQVLHLNLKLLQLYYEVIALILVILIILHKEY